MLNNNKVYFTKEDSRTKYIYIYTYIPINIPLENLFYSTKKYQKLYYWGGIGRQIGIGR